MKKTGYIGLLAGVLLAAGCQKAPLLVGVPLGLTGVTARLGTSARNGIQLAADEINADGGVGGRKIQLLIRDDQDDPDTAAMVDRELAQAGVIALVGHMSSKSGTAAIPQSSDLNMPLLSPTISSTEFSAKDDWFFRIIGPNDAQGTSLADWAIRNGKKQAAVVWEYSNRSYTEAIRQGFTERFTASGGKIILDRSLTTGQAGIYESLAKELAATNLDCVMIAASSYDTASLAQELFRLGADIQLLVSLWSRTDDLITLGGRAVEGVIAVTGIDPLSDTPGMRSFIEDYSSRFGRQPDFGALYGYEAMLVLAEAIRQAEAPSPEKIRNSLRVLPPVQGIDDVIQLDPFGDTNRPYHLNRVRNGRFETEDR